MRVDHSVVHAQTATAVHLSLEIQKVIGGQLRS
jgi:hypothetical protein